MFMLQNKLKDAINKLKNIFSRRACAAVGIMALSLALLIAAGCFSAIYAGETSEHISSSVLRLHIIADSDSDFDQYVKLKVRDRILSECGDMFKHAADSSDSLEIANANLDKISETANDELRKQGADETARAETGIFEFPTISYGDITLPKGSYRAVRIVIGEGAGHNWWCVMYPPLCFVDGVADVPEETLDALKANLSESEYELLTGSENIDVQFKFKLVEILGDIFH